MSEIFEVAVIGAGMFGSAAARHLSRAGTHVVVVGPAEPTTGTGVSQHAFGAHFDEARITRRLGWDEVWGTTDARSQERFADIEAESGITFFHERGSLVLMARSIGHRTDAILHQCANVGIAVERMSEDALRDEFPDLGLPPMSGGVEGLLERRQAGYLNPRRLVRAQLALTVAAGGRLLRAAVTGVHKDPASGLWCLRLQGDDGGSGDIRAERILVATGAFTNQNKVLPEGHRLALHAFSEPNLLFEIGDDQLGRLQHLPPVVTVDPEDSGDANMSLYLLPPIRYPDGKWYMRIGPGMQPIVQELRTVDEMLSWYSRQEITAHQEAFLTMTMHLLVPELKPVSVRAACCIIEKTHSRYPYLGHLDDDESLTVAVGGNGHGARGSDEIGRLAATVVLGQPWDCPIPQSVFAPVAAGDDTDRDQERPSFLKPPFGLC
jgi:sarcosine oxidase